ncbi:glycosyltransferase family 39 protein [Streptomyces marianii]|uniref:Glycosyltransferase RgtA/B/C/D-like domain-containing protein n=1 Tax=Streptomyces marianii TaxID=1817406 RepID=A0A5R9E2A3_9ACTN|nr:glycosyltransferase family 39 protein [Streptomyces marianii]TLQ44058.1 hypothetical protein FEF34_13785 [Streptomyces marianii]
MWPSLATLALAMHSIGFPQLGTDELVTRNVGRRSLDQLLGLLHHVDAVHSTYYLLMHGWMAVFGDSHTALRMPSALAMSAAAAFVALIGNRLFSRRAGLCGGLLFALIPVVSRFGQEARSYALVVMVATLATYLLIRAMDRPRSWGRWAAYAVCVAFTGLLHLVALSGLTAHLIVVARRARREGSRVFWSFCAAALAGTACVAPLFVLGGSQAQRQLFWVAEPDVWGLVEIWPQLFASALCAGVVIALAAMAWKERGEGLLLCASMAVLPPLVLWMASHGETSYFRYQYAMFTVSAWAVLAGAGIAAATRSWLPVTVGLGVLALLVLPDQRRMREAYQHDVPHSADYAGAARTIEKHHRPGDAMILVKGGPWMLDEGVRYYLPRDLKLREVFVEKTAAENHELYPKSCARPSACLRGEKRIWVVVAGRPEDPLASVPVIQAVPLRMHYAIEDSVYLSGLTVTLLERRPTAKT